MVRLSLSVVGLLIWVGLASAQARFSPKDSQCSIAFPKPPKEASKEAKTAIGAIQINTCSLDISRDVAYLLVWTDYPSAVMQTPVAKLLENVRDGSKGTGSIVTDSAIEVSDHKYPGRDFVLDFGSRFYRARAVLKGTRLYQVVIVAKNKDDVSSESANKFIDSFEITP